MNRAEERAAVSSILNSLPDIRLDDILAAFAEASQHRYAAIRACPDCCDRREQQQGTCTRHEADSRQGFTYSCLHDSFKGARSNPDSFAAITRALLRGPGYDPARTKDVEQVLAIFDATSPPLAPAQAAPAQAARSGGVGCIYVIEFSNGTVKVGRSNEPDRRLAAHRSQGRKFGADITDQWVSPQHAEWRQNEAKLIAIAHELGGTVAGAEYFTGVAFADIVTRAQELPFTTSLVAAGAT